jgi:hypothetical protein
MQDIFRFDDSCQIFDQAIIRLLGQISGSTSQSIRFTTGGAGTVNSFQIKLGQEL